MKKESAHNEGIYAGFAHGYDLVMADVDYPLWAKYVLDLVERYGLQGKTILNLACGTGSTEWFWANAGYSILGVDLSAEMIAQARQKNPPHSKIRFDVGDMRNLDLGEEFDYVFILYDSLNYLIDASEVQSCFQVVARHLKPNGGFVFDVATESNILTNFTNTTYAQNFNDFAYIWENEYNIKTKICRSDFYFFIREGKAQHFQRAHETHYQKIYTNRELLRWLREAGFEQLGSHDGFTLEPPNSSSERVHYVTRKMSF